jgi:hypothetical protein
VFLIIKIRVPLSLISTNYLLVDQKTEKNDSVNIKKKSTYRVSDDKEIEVLMRYYKLENPDALLRYLKMHGLPKDEDANVQAE